MRADASIRTRLTLLMSAVVAGVWIVAALFAYRETRDQVDELLDAYLAQSATLLLAQLGHELEEIDLTHLPEVSGLQRRLMVQIWESGKRLRLHSRHAPNSRLSLRDEGFDTVTIDDGRWRVFGAWTAGREFLVQIGEDLRTRNAIAAAATRRLVLPLMVALPLLALLIAWAVRRGLAPIDGLRAELSRRAPGQLEPIALASVPLEIAPVLENLNRLLERVRDAIENERRFTADAAHELRTPLAALRAQAQVARGARDAVERDDALDRVVGGCDRAAHLVDQMLMLARLEPDDVARRDVSIELGPLARAAIAPLVPGAIARNIEIELREPPSCAILGDETLLAVLIRNLVDNAVRYGPKQSVVTVSLAAGADTVTLTVDDQGPGVAPEERARLGQRFWRRLGSGRMGSGLGLSIVRRIADLHGAELEFEDAPAGRGLRARLRFHAQRRSGGIPQAPPRTSSRG